MAHTIDLLETSLFFVYPNGFGEHLFQMFIVLGMYNFAYIDCKFQAEPSEPNGQEGTGPQVFGR